MKIIIVNENNDVLAEFLCDNVRNMQTDSHSQEVTIHRNVKSDVNVIKIEIDSSEEIDYHYEKGYNEGYNERSEEISDELGMAHEQGYEEGFDDGISNGSEEEYSKGYEKGYEEGYNSFFERLGVDIKD